MGELSTRALSVVVYLNDVDQGGETDFPLQELKVKPKSGRICIFPSNFTHPHSGNPSLSNDKWIISTFLHGIVEPVDFSSHNHDHSHHFHENEQEFVVTDSDTSAHGEHYHVCVQCANGESHECHHVNHQHS
jgi:hypothetical protein